MNNKKLSIWEIITIIGIFFTLIVIIVEIFFFYKSYRQNNMSRERPALMIVSKPLLEINNLKDKMRITYIIRLRNQGSGNAYKVSSVSTNQIPPLHYSAQSKDEIFSSYDIAYNIFSPSKRSNIVVGSGQEDEFVFYEEFARFGMDRGISMPHILNHKKYFAFFYESESGKTNITIIGLSSEIDIMNCSCIYKIEEKIILNDPRQ